MSLMAKYDALVKYLEEKEYHGDPDLERMIDSLGIDAQDAEEEVNDLNEALQDMMHNRPRYYGEGF